MIIAAMTFRLRAPWVHSLKEKRLIVKSMIAQLQNKFHVSAAEIDEQDTHQIIVIGVAAIVPHNAMADSLMEEISLFVEENCEAEILEETREIRRRRRPSMEALEALVTRRSTRNYKPDPVEQEKIDKILEAGRQAPSGGNNQTSHFFVIRNREVLDKLIVMTEKVFAAMEVTENTYASMKHSINASKKGGYVFCYNAPVLIVVANRKDYGNNIADCACTIENMMVAANALDLGSCWINQLKWLNEDTEIVEYLRGFGMKENERVYGAVIIGYPATESGLPNRNLMTLKGNEVTWID